MTYNRKRQRKQTNQLKQDLLSIYGNECNICFGTKCYNVKLQVAHIKETELSGRSRGKRKRLYDIKNNQDSYVLLGKTCHIEYDANV